MKKILKFIFKRRTVRQREKPDDEDLGFPGPLISEMIQKEDLIQFIKKKSETCLSETNDPDHVEEYFFWQIMELFCSRNGVVIGLLQKTLKDPEKVRMVEVSILLLRLYGFIRQKFRDPECQKKWYLPIARLFCSAAPDDEQRQAVIKMGDDLAIRGLTYAAHICYVVAKVELGSCAGFNLIGCKGMPFEKTALNCSVRRTETYEYVLSLTSGLPQPNFQIFKLCYAGRLAILALKEQAFNYCESIARTVITLPSSFSRTFVGRVLLLSCNLLQQLQLQTEPEWLLELHQLHSAKEAETNANAEPEQHVSSTSTDSLNSECDPVTGKVPALQSSYLTENLFRSQFVFEEVLGRGGYGFVYAAVRKDDGRKVAIKFTYKRDALPQISVPGETDKLPLEVALMKMVCRPPCCSNIVKLLEWHDFPEKVVLVLERPSPCMDLQTFLIRHNSLSEAQTRDIMLQVIRAARHCCERGVFHRDIKAQNLLINTDTMEVKLIDFGCGAVLKNIYHTYRGTLLFQPPESVIDRKYKAISSTVWGLGVLLYELVYGKFPFNPRLNNEYKEMAFSPGVSRELFELVVWCLEFNPELRPTFEDLIRHEWFTKEVQEVKVRSDQFEKTV